MKTSLVVIAGGASTFTPVPATIPAKFVKAEQDIDAPTEPLNVQFRNPDGSFGPTLHFPAGAVLRHIREDGIIAMPPGYVASNVPATGEAYMQVNTPSGNGCNLRVYEYENIPRGTV